MISTKKRILLAAMSLLVALTMTGCFVSGNPAASGPSSETGDEVGLRIRMGVGSVTALGKSSVITLDKLMIVMSSSAGDTIRDTITSTTTPALNPVSTTGQTLSKNYSLKALRSWKIVATSRDALDSIIHLDSVTIPALYAGDTAQVNLNLSARFSMYEAKFLSLPDSIQSSVASQPKQALCIKKLVLSIDSVVVRDSVAPGSCFASGATYVLAYDYVRTGSRHVELAAYGIMNYWPVDSALYRGTATINAGSGQDSTVSLTLNWVGPTTGAGKIEAELGKVGKITINGTLPGTVL